MQEDSFFFLVLSCLDDEERQRHREDSLFRLGAFVVLLDEERQSNREELYHAALMQKVPNLFCVPSLMRGEKKPSGRALPSGSCADRLVVLLGAFVRFT